MAEAKLIFGEDDIKDIARVLDNAEITKYQDHWRIKVINRQEKRHLSIAIYPSAAL
jgi:hypothetical protein